MATELEAPFYIPCAVSTKRLEGSLVAPRVRKQVPNHLADTKTYVKVKQNGLLQTKPSVLHFGGYRVGEVHQQTLRIVNASKDNQQMHIIPPTTSFFSVKYSKQRSSLVPGLSLEVAVHFKPTEWRYYYDCIRVHCKGNHNLLIPIHAYPVMNTAKFPRQIKFPPTHIGQTRTKTIPLECDIPIDFEYQLTALQQHPAYTVTPMKGVVPANGKIDIIVTFSPTEFNTAIMKLQLELSQFNSTPIVCTFIGSSSPGLAVKQLRKHSGTLPHPLKTNVHHLPPLELTRHTSKGAVTSASPATTTGVNRAKKSRNSSRVTLPSKVEETIVRDGIRFSTNLDNTSAVNKVLNQQPGRMKASELRQVASLSSHTSVGVATQQMKEALFLQQVRQTTAEERANQLRWVTNLGGVAMSEGEKEEVLKQRKDAEMIYRHRYHMSVPESVYHQSATERERRRTKRRMGEHPQCVPTFDPYLNDTWKRRHLMLQRFIQAVRRVVVQRRCQRRLERLQQLSSDLKAGKSLQQSLADMSAKDPGVLNILSRLPKDSSFIQPFSFPKYIEQNRESGKQNHVEVSRTSISVKKTVPYINLKVPQEYKLMGYTAQPLSSQGPYIPPGLSRPLRSGAEDELDTLGSLIPGIDPSLLTSTAFIQHQHITIASPPSSTQHQPPKVTTSTARHTEQPQLSHLTPAPPPSSSRKDRKTRVDDIDGRAYDGDLVVVQDVEGEEMMSCASLKEVPLLPPPELLQTPQRDPLHVFNLAPGVRMYFPSLPNSEVTLDHTLLPLATYPSVKQSRVQLDPQDVIPGLMQWRQFPSHLLTTTEGGRRMASIWKPTRSDSFSSDMLPTGGSSDLGLMSGQQPDDFVDENSTEELPVPTMDMVRAQFHLPPSNKDERHCSSKERAVKHVTKEKLKQFDQLGERIRERLDAIDGLAGELSKNKRGVIDEQLEY